MPNTSDLKRGVRFEHDGVPYGTVDVSTQTPSARGATTLVKVKARDLLSGQLKTFTFKAGERLGDPDIELAKHQFLYREGDDFHFMNLETFDQVMMPRDQMGGADYYLLEEAEVRIMFYEGRPVSVELPNVVELRIVECDPAVRGDTVTAVTKNARLETGLEVQVPLFVECGERIRVDTRDDRYIERVKK
ncbi:MAG: elongation factor P [Deltaproteobacteria bacterium]|nr:elongation factor P [Deltaproteobacteria bacterium]